MALGKDAVQNDGQNNGRSRYDSESGEDESRRNRGAVGVRRTVRVCTAKGHA